MLQCAWIVSSDKSSIINYLYLFFVYNSCGTTPEHCGNIDPNIGQGNCQQTGCAPGLCCSRHG
jgi:hypothetical protein